MITPIQAPENFKPICPHCESQIQEIYTQNVKSAFGKTWIYCCPRCGKTLGVSQRKGFWMG